MTADQEEGREDVEWGGWWMEAEEDEGMSAKHETTEQETRMGIRAVGRCGDGGGGCGDGRWRASLLGTDESQGKGIHRHDGLPPFL